MLNIYPVALELAKDAARVARDIAPHDIDLARQMKRASTSVPLLIAEGSYSQGGNRKTLYHRALGSARETLSCAETAHAIGYLAYVDAELIKRADRVIGTLVNILKK